MIVLGYPRVFMGVDCNGGACFDADDMTLLNATADLLRHGRAQRRRHARTEAAAGTVRRDDGPGAARPRPARLRRH